MLAATFKEFTRTTPRETWYSFALSLRPRLTRVVADFNGKGGQGKTSITTHLGGLFAEGQVQQDLPGRVLVVDMDPQGNTKLDLGFGSHELFDNGASLVEAILSGDASKLKIITDVRPQLDVIPGGKALETIGAKMVGEQMSRGRAAWLGLAVVLADLSDRYDWILIDCPPTFPDPQELALIAARWVLVPVSFDEGSIQGLEGVSDKFIATEDLNPDLELLGAVLFGFEHKFYTDRKSKEKRPVGMWVETRAEIEALLQKSGADAPLFNAVIRDARPVAKACRARGQLAFELAQVTDAPKWWEIASGKKKGRALPTSRAELVGEDYEDLAVEVMQRIVSIEQEDAA
ncbi:ParA family protein [Streptomyces albogriseolus]|uniref:ParA family protein n=1 Tax=Streptomyces albogriseolus TaxID=1887 RepID=UPI0019924F20|nr:ParA family protein [Streptomyces sp.]